MTQTLNIWWLIRVGERIFNDNLRSIFGEIVQSFDLFFIHQVYSCNEYKLQDNETSTGDMRQIIYYIVAFPNWRSLLKETSRCDFFSLIVRRITVQFYSHQNPWRLSWQIITISINITVDAFMKLKIPLSRKGVPT